MAVRLLPDKFHSYVAPYVTQPLGIFQITKANQDSYYSFMLHLLPDRVANAVL